MRILMVTGSRADEGLLEWPKKTLQEHFEVVNLGVRGSSFNEAFLRAEAQIEDDRPDLMLILGDRYEILAAATAAHLARVPIAHIGGGDVTEGSYDDAMRDCISRMASIHFVTSTSAMARLTHMGFRNVHLVGNPAIDYIRHADWKKERPIAEPYVVVSYQAETIDGTNEFEKLCGDLPLKHWVLIGPNPDRGSEEIRDFMKGLAEERPKWATYYDFLPHDEFLNLIYHCDEFIGNSSSMLYEAPELGIKTRMVGKRQRGRTIPWGDGNASQRIANILRYCRV